MIYDLVEGIPDARQGFRLLFSTSPLSRIPTTHRVDARRHAMELVPGRRAADGRLAVPGPVPILRYRAARVIRKRRANPRVTVPTGGSRGRFYGMTDLRLANANRRFVTAATLELVHGSSRIICAGSFLKSMEKPTSEHSLRTRVGVHDRGGKPNSLVAFGSDTPTHVPARAARHVSS
jgi:hypothetical protein